MLAGPGTGDPVGARTLRVTGGALGGRRLVAAPGRSVRPTTDRVREALFARLGDVEGARVLDLYAGTGALGIEALSRGAVEVVFVERARTSLEALDRNVSALGLEGRCRILRLDVASALARLAGGPERFDLVLADPPYESLEAERALRAVVAAGVLSPSGTLVLERSRRHDLPRVEGLVLLDERRYGDTVLSRLAASASLPTAAVGDGGEGGAASRC